MLAHLGDGEAGDSRWVVGGGRMSHDSQEVSMSWTSLGTADLVLVALWLASCGQSGTGSTAQNPPSFFQVVDALNGGFSYAYAPSIIVKDGTYHVFFCSMAVLLPTWDAIRYTTSIGHGRHTPTVRGEQAGVRLGALISKIFHADETVALVCGAMGLRVYGRAPTHRNRKFEMVTAEGVRKWSAKTDQIPVPLSPASRF